jgi:hypothetical protein
VARHAAGARRRRDLHRGESFVVQSLDLEAGEAIVNAESTDYYTQAIVQSVVDPKMVLNSRRLGSIQASLVGISVTDAVVGFRRKTLDGDTVLSIDPLDSRRDPQALVRPSLSSGWEGRRLFPASAAQAHAPNMDRTAVALCPSVDPAHCAGARR